MKYVSLIYYLRNTKTDTELVLLKRGILSIDIEIRQRDYIHSLTEKKKKKRDYIHSFIYLI